MMLTNLPILQDGNVSDGSQLTSLSIIVRAPNGKTTTEELTLTGSDWSYELNPTEAGGYRIWVRAVDEAGNIDSLGFFIERLGVWSAI